MAALALVSGSALAEGFTVRGTRIIDPDGNVFIPIGANVSGERWAWGYKNPVGNSARSAWEHGWKFNCMRVNNFYFKTTGIQDNTGAWTIDEIVAYWTSRRVVVILTPHDYPDGSDTSGNSSAMPANQSAMAIWWAGIANNPVYRENPYVWFNIGNEIGGDPNGNDGANLAYWIGYHRACITAIRDAGANNIIVVDGMWNGQDLPFSGNSPTLYRRGAIFKKGQEVKEGFANIVFAFHAYALQDSARGFELPRFVEDWIDALHAKGLCVMIGEIGTPNYIPTTNNDRVNTVALAAARKGAGALAWHWSAGDGANLVVNDHGQAINSLTAPTNLTPFLGQAFWDLTHTHGFGLGTGRPPSGDMVSPTTPTNLDSEGQTDTR